eukprot:64990-Amphidinium_carterae.1
MSYGTLRFAHVQRSSIVSTDHNVFQGHCSRGKTLVAESRPGFSWCVPRYGVTGVDLGSDLSFVGTDGYLQCAQLQQMHPLCKPIPIAMTYTSYR